jgi:predicted nucleic acid-binding protein
MYWPRSEVLRRKERRGEITAEQSDAAALEMVAAIQMIELEGPFASATDMARDMAHGFYDCLYLAAAFRSGWPLIAADDRFVGIASQAKWRESVRSLREHVRDQP